MDFYSDLCWSIKEKKFLNNWIFRIFYVKYAIYHLLIIPLVTHLIYANTKFWNKKWIVWKILFVSLNITYTIFSKNIRFSFLLFVRKCFINRYSFLGRSLKFCYSKLQIYSLITQNYSNEDKWNVDYSGKLIIQSYISDNNRNRSVILLVIVLISRVLEFHIMECGRSGIRSSMFG